MFYGAIAVLGAPLLVALYGTFLSSSRRFDLLMEASAWGRWPTILKTAPRLRGHVQDFELDAREAVALANLGQLADGLAQLQQHADDVPRWMYLARLAELYQSIQQGDLAMEYLRQAHEEAPDNPTVQLDYAISLLKNETNTPLARQLIASAETKPLSDILCMIMPLVHGLCELNSNRNLEAKALFQEAQTSLAPLAVQPLGRLMLDTNAAYLAIACARTGDLPTAHRLYSTARKRLEALGAWQLLTRLNEAVGAPSQPRTSGADSNNPYRSPT